MGVTEVDVRTEALGAATGAADATNGEVVVTTGGERGTTTDVQADRDLGIIPCLAKLSSERRRDSNSATGSPPPPHVSKDTHVHTGRCKRIWDALTSSRPHDIISEFVDIKQCLSTGSAGRGGPTRG